MTPRRTRLAGAALALTLLLGACGGTGPTGAKTTEPERTGGGGGDETVPEDAAPTPVLPATGTNADGTTVEITDVSRIVPLWGNLSEIVFALGLGDNVVARDVTATFTAAEGLPKVTQGHDVSAETVLAQRPTLVLATPDSGPPEALDQIRKAGVPILTVAEPLSIDDVQARILTVSEALGVAAAGEALAERTAQEIEDVRATIPTDVPSPRIAFLYMRGQAGVYLIAGPGSGADSMIAAAGGIDAGTEMGLERPFTPLTSEALVIAAPEVILMTTTGLESVGGLDGLLEIPGIAQTPAGVARRIVTIEDGLLYSFGSRTPEALTELITAIYAEPTS